MSEEVLYTWVESESAIGPRIGVTSLDEALLKPLARFHLGKFEQRRKEQQQAQDDQNRRRSTLIAGVSAGAVLAGAVFAGLEAIGVL